MVLEDTTEWQMAVDVTMIIVVGIFGLIVILAMGEVFLMGKTEFLGAIMAGAAFLFLAFNSMLNKMDLWKNGAKTLQQKALELVPVVCVIAAVGLLLVQ